MVPSFGFGPPTGSWWELRLDVDRLCMQLGWLVARIHDYVSSDPHVRVDGTALPVVASGQLELPIFTPQQIARACAAALRVEIEALTVRGPSRALFVVMMRDQGWHNMAATGRHVGLSRSQTRKQSAPEQHVRAARMCLGDERLPNHI